MNLDPVALPKLQVKFLAISLVITLLMQSLLNNSATASIPLAPEKTKNFAQRCLQKKSLPAATRYTINVLLKEVGTQDCRKANNLLKTRTKLYLFHDLNGQIIDLQLLAGLTNLQELGLSNSLISDVQPLAKLTNLRVLYLPGNNISDVKPLAGLTKLTLLGLFNNQIRDVKSLARLTKLTFLSLSGNQIVTKVCPVRLDSTACEF